MQIVSFIYIIATIFIYSSKKLSGGGGGMLHEAGSEDEFKVGDCLYPPTPTI
jgi:hypothetical protein